MASRIQWSQVKPATVRGELIELVSALGLIAFGWLTLPTLLLAVMTELLATAVLSWHFYPQRGLRRHVLDVAKMLVLLCFLGAFILVMYGGAGGFADGALPAPREMFGVLLLVAVRGGLLLWEARVAPNPRLHWARCALMRGGALLVGTFVAIFTCFLPGMPLVTLLSAMWPERGADLALGATYLITVGVFACIMSTMSEAELADIAGQPYIDP